MSNLISFVIFLASFGLVLAKEAEAIRSPDVTLQMYYFSDNWTSDHKRPESLSAEKFSFEWGKQGYSLKSADGRQYLVKDVLYIKTFGGMSATVKVHLLNSRFLVYPETQADSKVPGAEEGDMMAITRVYDLDRKLIVDSSAPYQYCEDAPLRYDPLLVLLFYNRLNNNKPNNSGAGQPPIKTVDKLPAECQPPPPTSKDVPR